jgi:hypothetical protein
MIKFHSDLSEDAEWKIISLKKWCFILNLATWNTTKSGLGFPLGIIGMGFQKCDDLAQGHWMAGLHFFVLNRPTLCDWRDSKETPSQRS